MLHGTRDSMQYFFFIKLFLLYYLFNTIELFACEFRFMKNIVTIYHYILFCTYVYQNISHRNTKNKKVIKCNLSQLFENF